MLIPAQSDWLSILQNISDLECFIYEGMEVLGIPGLSLAIVEDNKTVFAKGYGVKQLGTSDRVDADTLMKIGSISKSMTSLMMAKLIDEKRFKWGTKVGDLCPAFKLWDKKLAKHMLMKDLVSGSTGLPRKDYPALLNYKADVVDQLSKIKPTANPGIKFQYNNQLGTAAGYIAAHTVLPKKEMRLAYQEVMKDKVFNPMGMTRTGFNPHAVAGSPIKSGIAPLTVSDICEGANFAYSHIHNMHGLVTSLQLEDDHFTDYQAPSSGIWSSANDMARYMITELQEGKTPEGVQVFSGSNLLYRRNGNIQIEGDVSYGYGWCLTKTEATKYIFHNGNTYGFSSYIMIFPEQKKGVITLTNIRTDERFIGFAEKIHELWTAKAEVNAIKRVHGTGLLSHKRGLTLHADIEFLERFVGRFYNDDLGEFVIERHPCIPFCHPGIESDSSKISGTQGNSMDPESVGCALVRDDSTIYLLKTPTHRNELLVHTRGSGQKILCLTNPPFDDIQLVPTEAGGFTLTEEGHVYEFTRC